MALLNFLESIKFLETNGINCLEVNVIESLKDLKKYLNFPYVMKISSSSLIHKTEARAVITDIFSEKNLEDAFKKLSDIIIREKIKADIVIQKQIKGLELIVGIKEDMQFGKIILFGAGGVYTEIIKDSSIRLLPVSKKNVQEMIEETKAGALISNKRISYNVEVLKSLILAISELAVRKDIKEMDLNPVILTRENVFIVDARVLL